MIIIVGCSINKECHEDQFCNRTRRSCQKLYCTKTRLYGGDFTEIGLDRENKTTFEIGYKIHFKCHPETIIKVDNGGIFDLLRLANRHNIVNSI